MPAPLPRSSQFQTAGATHVGLVRNHNEDGYLVRPDAGIWLVADGMGGHNGGDFASSTVVEALSRVPRQSNAAELMQACEAALAEANAAIRLYSARQSGAVIGTTVVVLLAFDGHFACLWSGDSRIYLARGGVVFQLSRDHTEAQDLVAQGALTSVEADAWPRRNVVTRAIGAFETPMLDRQHGELQAGDTFLLCSDGLTAHVKANEILAYMAERNVEDGCRQLIDLTLTRGACDNVTVVVARYRPGEPATVARTGRRPPAERE